MKTIIAETRGTFLISFCSDGESWRVPVIAWSIDEAGYSEPITVDRNHECGNAVWCLELCTGLWVFTEDRTFRDFAEAQEYARSLLGSAQP